MPNWIIKIIEFYKEKLFYRLSLTVILVYFGLAVLAETQEPENIDTLFNIFLGLFVIYLLFYGLNKINSFLPYNYHRKVLDAPKGKSYQGFIQWNLATYATLSEIDQMSGIEFEEFLIQFFQERGYIVTGTPKNGDFGADLIVKSNVDKIAVQAKCYVNSVGIEAVYQAIAGMNYYGCDSAMVITNSRFTSRAVELAKRARVELWDRKRLEEELNKFSR